MLFGSSGNRPYIPVYNLRPKRMGLGLRKCAPRHLPRPKEKTKELDAKALSALASALDSTYMLAPRSMRSKSEGTNWSALLIRSKVSIVGLANWRSISLM